MGKRGAKPKFDVNMSEILKLRLTSEQKALITRPGEYTGGTAEYVRGVMSIVSDTAGELEQGVISPPEFEKKVGSLLREFIVTSMEKGSKVEPD